MSACRVEIRVREPLADWWSGWFSELELAPAGPEEEPGTLLTGSLPDQSALFGVLARIRDLNLTLISVKRLPPG